MHEWHFLEPNLYQLAIGSLISINVYQVANGSWSVQLFIGSGHKFIDGYTSREIAQQAALVQAGLKLEAAADQVKELLEKGKLHGPA